jgi:exoribonuclease-2
MKDHPFINLKAIAYQAMSNYGFNAAFPENVIKEVEKLNITDFGRQEPPVRDLRNLLWSSIDNIDSKDLDQLEFCELASNNEIHVLVAIADVDAYVSKSSRTDKYAAHNGTSVYTGVEIFPMLPERLSADLSSLIEGQDRLAIIIEFFVMKDGSIRFGNVFRGMVNNKAKLVYESLGAWLENQQGPMPEPLEKIVGLKEQIILQDEAAQKLHDYRMEKGALELETIEASPIVHEGEVVDLVVKKKNPARYIIENFMVAANGTMVNFLDKKGSLYIQRVVRTPERWERICEVAKNLGTSLPVQPDGHALSEFLAKERKAAPDIFPDLSLTIVKLLGPGEYVFADLRQGKIGHFGLAVQDYTHSTAPNRRYVDLIIQRLLKAVLYGGEEPYNKGELSYIANWCTERDQAAKKVERFMRKVAGAMLLRDRLGETFDAIVTGVSDKGTYVRIEAPPVEGRVIRREKGMDVGEKVKVRLMRLEIERGYIDFEGMGS